MKIADLLPWAEMISLADEMVEQGVDDEDVHAHIVDFIDDLVDLTGVAPPLGLILESVDSMVIHAIVDLVIAAAKKPAREVRKAKRKERQATRKQRRAANRAEKRAKKSGG